MSIERDLRKLRENLVGAEDFFVKSDGSRYYFNGERERIAIAKCIFASMRGEEMELPEVVYEIAKLKTARERANALDKLYPPPSNPLYIPLDMNELVNEGRVVRRDDLTEALPFYPPRTG